MLHAQRQAFRRFSKEPIMKSPCQLMIITATLLFSQCGVAGQEQTDVVDSDKIADALAQPRTRGLSRAIGVRKRAAVDLKIPFEVNSSELAPEAQQQLEQLIDALSRDALSEYRFQVAGHTDASGSAEYNRQLSERRANTVMQYLIDEGVDPARLVAVGFGEDMLLLTDKPEHQENRRVEISNLGVSTEN
jgi:outer membrane protein OmpA-like peptidoglycan-associated protein